MLVLTRHENEIIDIFDERDGSLAMSICIVKIDRNQARVGITAERKTYKIMRRELVANPDPSVVGESPKA